MSANETSDAATIGTDEKHRNAKRDRVIFLTVVGIVIVIGLALPAKPTREEDPLLLPAQAKATLEAFHSAAGPCDAASQIAEASLGPTGNAMEAYSAAETAHGYCADAWSKIVAIDPPAAATGAVEEAFKTALSACGTAYSGRRETFKKLAKVIDGDQRPSTLASLRDEVEFTQSQLHRCVDGLEVAVADAQPKTAAAASN